MRSPTKVMPRKHEQGSASWTERQNKALIYMWLRPDAYTIGAMVERFSVGSELAIRLQAERLGYGRTRPVGEADNSPRFLRSRGEYREDLNRLIGDVKRRHAMPTQPAMLTTQFVNGHMLAKIVDPTTRDLIDRALAERNTNGKRSK